MGLVKTTQAASPKPVLGRIHSRPVVGWADVQKGQCRYGRPFGFEALLEGAGLFTAAGDEQAAAKERLALKPVELLTQRDDWADCDEGRRADLLGNGLGPAGVGDRRRPCAGRAKCPIRWLRPASKLAGPEQ